jgi:hypothetical protein
MYETGNDVSKNRPLELNTLMNQRLAEAVDLQMQMKQAHWNVKGSHFTGLHELFDKIDEAVESYVGLIAKRIVQPGGMADWRCSACCLFASSHFHCPCFLAHPPENRTHEVAELLNDLAITAAALFVVVSGSGTMSLDAFLR